MESSVHLDWDRDSPLLCPSGFTATTIEAYIENSLPPLLLCVSSFEDGTIVSLIWPHVLFDGSGVASLLRSWSMVLAGKTSQVPAMLGHDDDPLRKTVAKPPAVGGSNQSMEFPMYKLFMILLWIIWRAASKPRYEKRFMVLTEGFIARLRERAARHAGPEYASKLSRISDGILLTAWVMKMVARSDNDYSTALLAGVCNARQSLPELQSSQGEYMQNLVATYFVSLSRNQIAQPLLQLAATLRDHTRERVSPGEISSFFRDKYVESLGNKPSMIYKPRSVETSVRLPILYNNLTSLDITGAVDFAPAVSKHGRLVPPRANSIGTPLYMFQGHAVEQDPKLGVPSFCLQGRTAEGSYYADTLFAPATYAAIEQDFSSLEPK